MRSAFRKPLHNLATAGCVAVIVLLGGCATTGSAPATSEKPVTRTDTTITETEGDYGFIVTETVRIGSDVRNDYQQAVLLLESERLQEGITLLESVVERAPEVTIPHIDLAVAYMKADQLEAAEESLRAALSLAPNHPAALNEMGILQRRAGKFDSAREYYERVLAIHPHYHFALRNLGVLCDLYLADLDFALDAYERYADIVTDDEEVGIWIADIRNRLPAEES